MLRYDVLPRLDVRSVKRGFQILQVIKGNTYLCGMHADTRNMLTWRVNYFPDPTINALAFPWSHFHLNSGNPLQ